MENNDLLWTETKEIIKEATRLAQVKADLRVALNEAGFPIPKELKLSEWIPIIKEVAGHGRTDAD